MELANVVVATMHDYRNVIREGDVSTKLDI